MSSNQQTRQQGNSRGRGRGQQATRGRGNGQAPRGGPGQEYKAILKRLEALDQKIEQRRLTANITDCIFTVTLMPGGIPNFQSSTIEGLYIGTRADNTSAGFLLKASKANSEAEALAAAATWDQVKGVSLWSVKKLDKKSGRPLDVLNINDLISGKEQGFLNPKFAEKVHALCYVGSTVEDRLASIEAAIVNNCGNAAGAKTAPSGAAVFA